MDATILVGGQMQRRAEVFLHGERTGELSQFRTGFRFAYDPSWLARNGRPVSASLPLQPEPFESIRLFPFFQGLLSEGDLRRRQMRQYRLEESDDFGLLLATCQEDTAGAVTVRPLAPATP